ncbi:hypothetical protein ACFC1R_19210 [Kitasatospora sp. NPDC056138]|uniref:hypothetical protein n=1 Tax=Kitasatospora sp. NPDC056138 TaxID=3345724 RepID=UPI0035DC2EA3
MSGFSITLVVSGTVLVVILASDLGRRRVTAMRLIRPLIAVAIVMALFFHSPKLGGNDLSLQLVGVGTGIILGLTAGAMLPAHLDSNGQVYTRAGILYALFWIVMSAARVLFVYGIEHWYTARIIEFAVKYRISGPEVFSNSLVLMALATVLARTVVVMNRRRRLRISAR